MSPEYLQRFKDRFTPSIIVLRDKHGDFFFPALTYEEACLSCLRILDDFPPYTFGVYDTEPTEPTPLSFKSKEEIPEELQEAASNLLSRSKSERWVYKCEKEARELYQEVKNNRDLDKAYSFVMRQDHPSVRIELEELNKSSHGIIRGTFIQKMAYELSSNNHAKGSWESWKPDNVQSINELTHHVEKLESALELAPIHKKKVSEYCADIANIVMKIEECHGEKS